MRMSSGDIRTGKEWYAVQTKHYLIMFDEISRNLVKPRRFAVQAEARLTRIASLLGLRKSEGRYAIKGLIPYFVHDPKVLDYGNVEFSGIDVPASGKTDDFYRHEEAHAILTWAAGEPPAFFNEGFACFASAPNSDVYHRCSLVGFKHGFIPTLKDIASSDGFWKHYKTYKPFMYWAAGSFMAWALPQRSTMRLPGGSFPNYRANVLTASWWTKNWPRTRATPGLYAIW